MNTVVYRQLSASNVNKELFAHFDRTQIVTKCWRKINGEWVVKDIAFIDNWSPDEYTQGIQYLRSLITSGGYAVGAFINTQLKGFASVEPASFGSTVKYMDLSNIHVSRDKRGNGIGKELFRLSATWAKQQGADKLYISAHSSVESQAFYHSLGCVEAIEYNKALAEKEPCDCQLEYVL